MYNLLTEEEYKELAIDMDLPSQAFIDGRFQPAISAKTFSTVNPATGQILTEIADCDEKDVDFAVGKAREAFEDGRWCKLPPADRKAVLIRLSMLLERNARELAVMESIDSGKTIYDCETVDIPETINCIRWYAEAIDKVYDQMAPASDNHIAMIVREPIGVVGLVLPWNFPLLMLAWKIGPALATGCSLVVKPAEETSLTALRVAELAHEAGVPKGVLNIVTGSGPNVGQPLGLHMDVDMISFTGSTETGRKFLRYSANSNLKEIVLEMGGKNPCIVMDDADDLDSVAVHVVNGAFWNMGENCSAISRLIVHEAIKIPLLDRIISNVQEWPLGDPLNPKNRIGALVSKAHFDKVCSYLGKGNKVHFGGSTVDGIYVQPTIMDVNDQKSIAVREEIFGPILSVSTIKNFEEAIRLANDTDYGLTASVFTTNVKGSIRGSRDLKAGTVTVNSFGEGDISTPFGGYKQSGFGGRDKSMHAFDQYTQLKTIWIDLS
jgi:gamma-glutamyl-gamma-aminobutyraldehyde dehydrogenase